MIGIIGAMRIEIDGLKAIMENPVAETVSGIEYISGRLCGADAVVAVCGVGKVFAAMCAQTMILKYSPSLIINTGVGGALSPELSVGDVAVASAVVQHDMDTSALGDPKGLISGIDIVEIPCDRAAVSALVGSIKSLGISCVTGVIASGDRFVCESADKRRITDEFGAVACEMEGGSIGQVCFVNNVPFAVIRAVSDSADGEAVTDFPRFAAASAKNSNEAVKTFLSGKL